MCLGPLLLNEIQRRIGFFHLNLLWILGGVIGVFLAIDLFLFFFFWEMMLVPMYFLIALWGHSSDDGKKTRIYAATKFFIFTQASGLVMLVAILGLVFVNFNATGVITFDYATLLKTQLSPPRGMVADARLLHRLRGEDAGGAGAFLAAGRPRPGAHRRLRGPRRHPPEDRRLRPDPLRPAAVPQRLGGIRADRHVARHHRHLLRCPAVLRADRHQAPGCLLQRFAHGLRDDRHLPGSQVALQGVVVQMVAHGLSAAALFILCGQLYERLHTRDMRKMGGLWSRMPYLPAISLFFASASLGLPGTGNFVGEFLILIGAFKVVPVIIVIATFGLVFASVYSLIMIHCAYFGPSQSDEPILGLDARELSMVLGLAVLLVLLGSTRSQCWTSPRPACTACSNGWAQPFPPLQDGSREMTFTIQHFIALLPLLITSATLVVVMLAVAWKRNHSFTATLSVIGLNLALLSLLLVLGVTPIEVTPLVLVDNYACFYMALVLVSALACVTLAHAYMESYPGNREELYLLLLLATAGGLVLVSAQHLASLFIGLELLSVPVYGMVAYAFFNKRSLEAGIKYTVLPAAGSAFLLFGMALLYAESGTLGFAGLGAKVAEHVLERSAGQRWCRHDAGRPGLCCRWCPSTCGPRMSTKAPRRRSRRSSPPPARSRCSPCCCGCSRSPLRPWTTNC